MTRNTEGNTFKLQSKLQTFLLGIVVDYDDSEEEEEEEEEEDSSGGDLSKEGEEESGSSGTIKDPEKKRLSDEAAKYRTERNEAKKELEDARNRLKEIDDSSKSELEKAQRDLTEATQKMESLEGRDNVKARKLAFYESGSAGLFQHPSHALSLLDLSDLELNEEGEIDAAEMKKKADALIKEFPYLGSDSEGGDEGGGESGGETGGKPLNGRRKKDKDFRDAALRKKFPALGNRV